MKSNKQQDVVPGERERRSKEKNVSAAKPPRKDRQFVTALARGLRILRAFSSDRRELGSSQIARLTKLPQPTVWRLCKTLLDEGYLLPTASGDKLQLSPILLSLGQSALASVPILDIARPSMQIIADRFAASVALGARENVDTMLVVQRCQGKDARLLVNVQVGDRRPITGSTMGGAYIGELNERELDELMEELKSSDADNWTANKKMIEAARREYRESGYIVREFGVLSVVGSAFRSPEGKVHAITCAMPPNAYDTRTMHDEIAPALVHLARSLSDGTHGVS